MARFNREGVHPGQSKVTFGIKIAETIRMLLSLFPAYQDQVGKAIGSESGRGLRGVGLGSPWW